MPILTLERDDPERELDFELRFLLSLTLEQRYHLMDNASKLLRAQLERYGHRTAPKLLSDRSVEFVIIGAAAFPMHGYARATLDLDLFIRASEPNASRTLGCILMFP